MDGKEQQIVQLLNKVPYSRAKEILEQAAKILEHKSIYSELSPEEKEACLNLGEPLIRGEQNYTSTESLFQADI